MILDRVLSKLYDASPRGILNALRRTFGKPNEPPPESDAFREQYEFLRQRFQIYKTPNLSGIGTAEFHQHLQSRIGTKDAGAEGYSDAELRWQRDLSVEFHWGHDHDFGEFQLKGRMEDRHLRLLANFITLFPISSRDFDGKDVFDIGCWTGGTTLLLAALGSRVFAIEEVKKYAETAAFLSKSFGIGNRVSVEARSIYSCNSPDFSQRFDIVHFPGVIYHLSDPVVALRILYNATRMGGVILIESAGIDTSEPYCRFWGNKTVQKDAHSGWAWFWPSPSALSRMMKEAGFSEVNTLWHAPTGRVYGYGKKVSQAGICKAGLSVPNLS